VPTHVDRRHITLRGRTVDVSELTYGCPGPIVSTGRVEIEVKVSRRKRDRHDQMAQANVQR
jgi:hypothetical protein